MFNKVANCLIYWMDWNSITGKVFSFHFLNIDFVIVTLQVENRLKRKQRESDSEHCAMFWQIGPRLNDVELNLINLCTIYNFLPSS